MFKRFYGIVVAALLLCSASAQAADYRLDFTATNFVVEPPYHNSPPPFNLATGYVIFSADSSGSNWNSVSQFGLTIGDAHYTLSDVGVELRGSGASVGGSLSGTYGLTGGTNDFGVFLNSIQTDQTVLFYTSQHAPDLWYSITVKQTVSAIPEPETYAMLLAGLGLMGFVARRRKA